MKFFWEMLPHSYRNLFSYIIWRGNFWHPIWIFATFWISVSLWRFFASCTKFAIFDKIAIFTKIAILLGAWRFFAICAKFAIFAKFCHFRQNRYSPRRHFWHPIWVVSPLTILAISCLSGHKWLNDSATVLHKTTGNTPCQQTFRCCILFNAWHVSKRWPIWE